jgi:hypothetical protein
MAYGLAGMERKTRSGLISLQHSGQLDHQIPAAAPDPDLPMDSPMAGNPAHCALAWRSCSPSSGWQCGEDNPRASGAKVQGGRYSESVDLGRVGIKGTLPKPSARTHIRYPHRVRKRLLGPGRQLCAKTGVMTPARRAVPGPPSDVSAAAMRCGLWRDPPGRNGAQNRSKDGQRSLEARSILSRAASSPSSAASPGGALLAARLVRQRRVAKRGGDLWIGGKRQSRNVAM